VNRLKGDGGKELLRILKEKIIIFLGLQAELKNREATYRSLFQVLYTRKAKSWEIAFVSSLCNIYLTIFSED
jgi:hypothetical protein